MAKARPVAIITLVAVAYILAGLLSRWLISDQCYLCPVRRAAGGGLTAVLHWGYRAAVGVWFGSCLTNFLSLYAAVNWESALLISAVTACGAAAEAMLARALLQ